MSKRKGYGKRQERESEGERELKWWMKERTSREQVRRGGKKMTAVRKGITCECVSPWCLSLTRLPFHFLSRDEMGKDLNQVRQKGENDKQCFSFLDRPIPMSDLPFVWMSHSRVVFGITVIACMIAVSPFSSLPSIPISCPLLLRSTRSDLLLLSRLSVYMCVYLCWFQRFYGSSLQSFSFVFPLL